MKKYALFALFASAAGFALADNFTAVSSGNWAEASVWQDGLIPDAEGTVSFMNGIELDITTAVTVKNTPWANHLATINITGENASLTYTQELTMFGNTRLTINVEDGATLDSAKINWGDGGYSNIYVTNGSTLNANFDQMKGSSLDNGGSELVIDNSSALMKNQWNIGCDNKSNYSLVVKVSGENAVLQGASSRQTLAFRATSTSIAKLIMSDGAQGEIYDLKVGTDTDGGENRIIIQGEGTKLAANSVNIGKNDGTEGALSVLQFGGFDESGDFVAADAGALTNSWEVKVQDSGTILYLLGAENASLTQDKSSAIFKAQYFKSVNGIMEVDLSNIAGLEEGDYWFALLSSAEDISTTSNKLLDDVPFDWDTQLKITDTGGYTYNGWEVANNTLYISVHVPEPATYAAIFGALALAFAAYRKIK